ncbi:MAG: flap endonuclease [Polyangiaceae bacterium]|nr:flap endonuclease [Polyangiaceae bacterium]
MKVHLLDGTYELFRAFYGPPGAKSPSGMEVGATRALMRSVLSLLREKDVSHVACAFDHTVESFRNQMFDGYKTGEGMDADLFAQFELAERALSALGVVVWPMVEFEADDALATAAGRYSLLAEVSQVVICSPDKDMSQCVRGQKVICRDRMRDKIIDEDGVWEKFGVGPASIPDYLALVGDSADGIPGIPRWGAKGTSAVLSRFSKIEEIPASADDWGFKLRGAATLAKNLEEAREDALLYRRLATLREDVPLQESLDDLKYSGPDRSALTALAEEIGDTRLLQQIPS